MPLRTGDIVPKIRLYNQERKLSVLICEKFKVHLIAFFPGAFTDLCTEGIRIIDNYLDDLDLNLLRIVGVTVDSPFVLEKWAEENRIRFDLLSDSKLNCINTFGAGFTGLAGMENYESANRAVFITDGSGCILYDWVGKHPGDTPDYEEILTKAQSLCELPTR